MPLTNEQKTNVRQAIAAEAEKQRAGLRERSAYEARRDALAYEIIQRNPETVWGDAQRLADEQLAAETKPDKPAKAPKAKPTEEPVGE